MANPSIGDKVLQARKQKGITQQQLADMVGVSAGAVCKWETGNSTPDIALLAPLARALRLSLDELLCFDAKLPQAEVLQIKEQLTAVFLQDGYEVGQANCMDRLHEYPNDLCLQVSIASLLGMKAMLFAQEDAQDVYQQRMQFALRLLAQVAATQDRVYAPQALFLIANMHMMLGNYDESEAALQALQSPDNAPPPDPMTIYPFLLLQQGKHEQARLLCQQRLLQHVSQCTALLATNANILLSAQNYDPAKLHLEAIAELENRFGIGLHSGEYSLCKLYIKKGQLAPAASFFLQHITGVLHTGYDYSHNPYFNEIRLSADAQEQRFAREKMLESYINQPDLQAMTGLPDYEAAIALLQSALQGGGMRCSGDYAD